MTVTSALVPQPHAAGDIVGFNLQNATSAALAARYVTFGEVFKPGAVAADAELEADVGGQQVAVQMDAKTFNADGSVAIASVTLEQPALAAGQTVGGMLSLAPVGSLTAAPVDMAAALASHSVFVGLSFADGTADTIDIGADLNAALADGSATTWLSGPLANQCTVDIPVTGSLHLLATVTAYADGTLSAKIGYDNDIAMSAAGGTQTYATTISVDGKVGVSQSQLTQYQYEDWNATAYSPGTTAQAVNVQHDAAYLEATGVVPNYNLAQGVADGVIAGEAAAVAAPGWDAPLVPDGLTQYMGQTGGRPDIGLATQENAAWVVTQNPTAAAYALGQADSADGIPWHFWDPASGTWLGTDQYPDLWTDPRGGAGSYTTGLTQQWDSTNNGWLPDTAHQPDTSYDAYLMTGDQTYLQDLNAQASASIISLWPAGTARNEGQDLLVQGEQLRSGAWSLREVDEAAYADPAGAEKDYFKQVSDTNWRWLVDQIPAWTTSEGQAYGYVPGTYGPGGDTLAPWQQDYLSAAAAEAATEGNADALTFLKWTTNYIAGRFLNAAAGGDPHDGIAYNVAIGTPDGTDYQTWAQIASASAAAGVSNGTGWAQSGGDYGELAAESLAGIITLTGSSEAIQAYNWLVTSGAPYMDAAIHQSDVQFDVLPKLPAGMSFAADGTIVASTMRPVLLAQAPDQRLAAGAQFSFSLPAASYSDPAGGTISYTASLVDGSALPGWLGFDPQTGTFSGSVPAGSTTTGIRVVATTSEGTASAEAFKIYGQPSRPVLAHQEGDQRVPAGTALTFTLPKGSFSAGDGSAVAYAASSPDGTALPGWLTFDPATETFSGRTPVGSTTTAVEVTATTPGGGSAAEAFKIYSTAPVPVLSVQEGRPAPGGGRAVPVLLALVLLPGPGRRHGHLCRGGHRRRVLAWLADVRCRHRQVRRRDAGRDNDPGHCGHRHDVRRRLGRRSVQDLRQTGSPGAGAAVARPAPGGGHCLLLCAAVQHVQRPPGRSRLLVCPERRPHCPARLAVVQRRLGHLHRHHANGLWSSRHPCRCRDTFGRLGSRGLPPLLWRRHGYGCALQGGLKLQGGGCAG